MIYDGAILQAKTSRDKVRTGTSFGDSFYPPVWLFIAGNLSVANEKPGGAGLVGRSAEFSGEGFAVSAGDADPDHRSLKGINCWRATTNFRTLNPSRARSSLPISWSLALEAKISQAIQHLSVMLASIGGIESPQSHQQNPFRPISLATSKGIPCPARHRPLHRRHPLRRRLQPCPGHHLVGESFSEFFRMAIFCTVARAPWQSCCFPSPESGPKCKPHAASHAGRVTRR